MEVGCREDCGWREGACVGECLGWSSSQWLGHDTSKLNEESGVRLVLVGVDTNRQTDPMITSIADCFLTGSQALPHTLLFFRLVMLASLPDASELTALGLGTGPVIKKCTGYTCCSCGGGLCCCRQYLRQVSRVGDSGWSLTFVGGREGLIAGLGRNGFYL